MPDATYPLFFRLRGGPPGDSPMWVRYCMEHRVQHTEHYYSHDLRNGVHPKCGLVRGKGSETVPIEFGPVGKGCELLRKNPDDQLVKHCTTKPVDGINPIKGLACEDMLPHAAKSCPAVQEYFAAPTLCEGCDAALPPEPRVSEAWCPSCLGRHRKIASKAREFRRVFTTLAKNHPLSIGIAAIMLGEYGKRPFINRRDFLDIQGVLSTVVGATPEARIPVTRPKLNLRQLVQGVEESVQDRALARRLVGSLVPARTNGADRHSKLHQMVVHSVIPPRGSGGRAAYYSRCLECDAYSSKYWDPRDCPTQHVAEDYAL